MIRKEELEKLRELIKNNDFNLAKNKIDEISKRANLINTHQEEMLYSEFISLRIALNSVIGRVDDEIRTIVRNLRYPSENEYFFKTQNNTLHVVLRLRDVFLDKGDTIINAVNTHKWFEDVEETSASEFKKRLGIENIKKQMANQKLEKGNFIILNHPELNIENSYHIIYEESTTEDMVKTLSDGLDKVLADANKRKIKNINFMAFGITPVIKSSVDEKDNISFMLADKVAERIRYFLQKEKSNIKKITFNFVTYLVMIRMDKAIDKWSKMTDEQVISTIELNELEQRIVDSACTLDLNYIQSLKLITRRINDNKSFLITGETGVGKTYLAEAFHKNSSRNSAEFVSINCSVLTKENLNIFLWGAKKGSYTGAIQDIEGAIKKAENGTLFLDEIHNASIEVQNSLLTFLDNGKYKMYGDQKEIQSNVKIIFGTNVNLINYVKKEYFKKDLYERIANRVLHIPPIRKRPCDIELIVYKFMNDYNTKEKDRFDVKINNDAFGMLLKYKWYGNTRQLKAYLEDLFFECDLNNKGVVDKKMIKKFPPRTEHLIPENDFEELESLLRRMLSKHEIGKGNLLDEIIKPILANIFENDLSSNYTKKEAIELVGMDYTRKDPTLLKYYKKYSIAKTSYIDSEMN